jgi:type I site-specific restriction endonuclease
MNEVETRAEHIDPALRAAGCGVVEGSRILREYFGEYPPDFFDFIVVDECHRGGANDESTWRAILEYFSPAVQVGLTATPKRKDNVDTCAQRRRLDIAWQWGHGHEDLLASVPVSL